MLTETKVVEVLVCESSISGFESRQSPQDPSTLLPPDAKK
jgi:hypothetical protein